MSIKRSNSPVRGRGRKRKLMIAGVKRPNRIKHLAVSKLEADMLRQVRAREGVSRVGLARLLKLAPSTAGLYVDRLISQGFLLERRTEARDQGRPPSLLSLNPRGGRFIGVDFEARNIMAALVNFSQEPLRRLHRTIERADTVERIIGKIEGIISELSAHAGGPILGIGLAVPGIIDPKNGVGIYYAHIRGWEHIDLASILAKRFKTAVFVENNIRSMALAEHWAGQARGLSDFVCIGIRSGIGAGIVARGRLLHGRNNLAGEIGEWLCPIGPIRQAARAEDIAWESDRLQPLEEIASVPAVLRAAEAVLGGRERAGNCEQRLDRILKAANDGNARVCEALRRVAETLGWVVCQIDSLINPERVIFAGPLAALGGHLLEPMNIAVRKFASEHHPQPPVVLFSKLGRFNGALGAAALAFNEWQPRR